MTLPVAWTIAGSDASCGAGIAADLLTMQHLNVHACTVITAATAQSGQGIKAINLLPTAEIKSQMDALHATLFPAAIKLGMLGNCDTLRMLATYLQNYSGKVVLDPILISSSGVNLFNENKNQYIQDLQNLFPYVDLLTPNLPEAESLLNYKIESHADMVAAANQILGLGVKSVVIKGGHHVGDAYSHDYFSNGKQAFWLAAKRYTHKNYRGSGCVFSSAVTASLAMGYSMQDALVIAKMVVSRGIRLARHAAGNTAYLYHAALPDEEIDLPLLLDTPLTDSILSFPSCGDKKIGLYPVVDSSEWVKRLLPLGINTIQLRIKDKSGMALVNEIKTSIALAKQYQARLFINDYWEMAIEHGAYGVHIGQEDLNTADIKKIHAADLRLGLSSHCHSEVARAYAIKPSYIACGPIYATTSKVMPFLPQGLEKLHYWRRLLPKHALVAIGGINAQRMQDVMQTGVDGIAMISAITAAQNPEQETQTLLGILQRGNGNA